ncbi:DNA cytosine methyltransferase [Leifsonia xyli]|uniref:DNA cytosine methyltransferase n=1 Tax=Leifsonia xyli TaxID=1575 RepID=UPI00159F17A4|nr:DNA cytosine methyltransferase [Leifsonia xyli]
MRADELSKAITGAATREFVHPSRDRTLTLREAALQNFPDAFAFIGTKADVATMIGNAIPPKFAVELASAVQATLAQPLDSLDPGIIDFRSTNAEAMSPALSSVVKMVEQRYRVAKSALALF